MDRFAFKIDAALKANLCKICRLCGIDNPEKVHILLPNEGESIDLDEPSMSQKIYELVGFTVSMDDKMPQTMCSQCVDKINDFYEFREMCYATNKQTRNLLGLKQIEPTKLIDLRPIVKEEPQLPGKRGRKRKGEDSTWPRSNLGVKPPVKKEPFVWHKKQKLQTAHIEPKTEPEIKEEPAEPGPWKKGGRKSICSVCGEKFPSKELAEEHKSLVHVPSIPRYMCNACNQTHHNQSDIRAHQLWHKLSKTPYKCPLCDTSVANAYAFARHMREHTPPTPVQLLVLDRECPLCKKTFVTNFLFNTHRCAIRKRRCGGCSRALNTDTAYMRHAPFCSKIYLGHSRHVMPEMLVTNEANEEELLGLPPAVAVPPDFVIDEAMLPVVVLERLSSPLLRASGASKSRNNRKSYLKRVDQLLKNTMSTLVSIKHEPEVHINDTGPAESDPEEPPAFGDDFQAANDDSEDEAQPDDVPSVSVKQEPQDDAYDKQMAMKQEPLKLKLKITKNHGKLNSSLIDELDEAGQASNRSSKKKKKRKHKEREKEAESQEEPAVRIKQEPVDYAPEATVMTTIPMAQLEQSNFNDNEKEAQPQEDVKPNRLELDRMMQISHVASGVDMAEEAMPLEKAEEATPDEQPKAKPVKSTARKSTGGAQRKTHAPLPQIVAVVSGESAVKMMPNVSIKPEPRNRGYGDEEEEINHNDKMEEEEHAYIDGLDLSNLTVKQEKDLDISESEAVHCNGLEKGDDDGNDSGSSADEAEEATEEDEEQRIYREIELPPLETQRVAEEASNKLPVEPEKMVSDAVPAEETPPQTPKEVPAFSMVITSICSQAVAEITEAQAEEPQSPTEEIPSPSAKDIQSSLEVTSANRAEISQENPCSTLENPGKESDEEIAANLPPTAVENQSSVNEASVFEDESQSLADYGSENPPTVADQSQEEVSNLKDASGAPVENQYQELPAKILENPPVTLDENESLPSGSSATLNLGIEMPENLSLFPSNPTHSPNEPSESLEKAANEHESPAENADSVATVSLTAPKDNEAQALPICNAANVESNYMCDEEQQNVLNHTLSEQQQAAVEDEQQLLVQEEQPALLEVMAPGPSTRPIEETENRINEQQQDLDQEEQRPPRCQANDDSNINEIAENNNNANIERELQDDALGAQENVNP
ncbi:uncharacterized protein [Drosophila takahashii]|uniref:uncharacterized protein n=1 Tax=Drosophila takahashii TaxID=29030 RepID=UPI001CF8E3DF|nr:putative leucine-rich repeat-containing protein DDB_G0290503 [Drosophila takahashii]